MSHRYDEALEFAKTAHAGAVRKGTQVPYIVHPVETSEIVSMMTDDEDVIIAALLHDVIEDTDYTEEDIRTRFGNRVADLVVNESENKHPDMKASDSWFLRKQETIDHLKNAERAVLIITLADKLSNMRSTANKYRVMGNRVWELFNQKSRDAHKWYHMNILEETKSLSEFPAWQEYKKLCEEVFEITGGQNG